jgi:hypothetical protein
MDNVVYACAVTEYEARWGNRPDGYLLALDQAAMDAKSAEINGHQGHEFSRTETVKLVMVTPECYAKVKASPNGWLWLHENRTEGWLVTR